MTQNRPPHEGDGREDRPAQDRREIRDRPLGETRRPPSGASGDRPAQRRAPSHPAQGGTARHAGERQGYAAGQGGQASPRRGQQERPAQRPSQGQRSGAPARRPVEEVRYQPRQARPGQRQERIDPNMRDPDQEYAFQTKQMMRQRQRRMRRVVCIAALLLVVLAVFAVKLAVDLGGGANTFYEGVSVDGLKLNGYTKEEAKGKIEVLNAERIAGMTVKLTYADREWSISPDQMGVELNIDEILDQAWELGRTGNIFARQKEIGRLKKEEEKLVTALHYDEEKLRAKLSEVKTAVDLAATNATVSFDPSKEEKFKITQESNGRSVNLEALVTQVKTQLDNGFTTPVEIKPDIVAPTVLAVDLEQATKRIVRTTTDLGSSSEARIHNVKTALNFFNGMIVQPGQEISFNATTGPRGLEQGYQNAGVIQDDEIVDGPGGGVCQVSTTLYQAVVKANLEIVRSNKHSLPVSYVDVGTDAAVAYDYKDLIFKNNTEYPIFIEGKVSGKTVAVSIYGLPLPEGMTVDIITEVYETIKPAEPKTVLDTAGEFVTYTDETKVKKKARDGVKVKSFRVVKQGGEEVSRQLLRDDYYKEVQGEIYQGVTPREGGAPTPPSEE